MRAAIMQPYFFPYIGYWQLFFNCDVWVFFDSVQYNKKSWMNRNRILHPDADKEYQYITVPIKKHDKGALIRDAVINHDGQWQEKIMGQLTVYRRLRAPYYDDVVELVSNVFKGNDERLVPLIVRIADALATYVGKKPRCLISSDLGLDEKRQREADDWALEISRLIGADTYINPYGGAEIFDVSKYHSMGIDIRFLKPSLKSYMQAGRRFVAGLSIIDVLMFNSKSDVCSIICDDFRLLSKQEVLDINV